MSESMKDESRPPPDGCQLLEQGRDRIVRLLDELERQRTELGETPGRAAMDRVIGAAARVLAELEKAGQRGGT